jgi:hypothetical protein
MPPHFANFPMICSQISRGNCQLLRSGNQTERTIAIVPFGGHREPEPFMHALPSSHESIIHHSSFIIHHSSFIIHHSTEFRSSLGMGHGRISDCSFSNSRRGIARSSG